MDPAIMLVEPTKILQSKAALVTKEKPGDPQNKREEVDKAEQKEGIYRASMSATKQKRRCLQRKETHAARRRTKVLAELVYVYTTSRQKSQIMIVILVLNTSIHQTLLNYIIKYYY